VTDKYVPTTRLRWIERASSLDAENASTVKVLQQYFAEDLPGYMRNDAKGEWRDVITVEGAP
jgi:hypothetical protein